MILIEARSVYYPIFTTIPIEQYEERIKEFVAHLEKTKQWLTDHGKAKNIKVSSHPGLSGDYQRVLFLYEIEVSDDTTLTESEKKYYDRNNSRYYGVGDHDA